MASSVVPTHLFDSSSVYSPHSPPPHHEAFRSSAYMVLSGECPGEAFWCNASTFEGLVNSVRQVWGEDYVPLFKYRVQASTEGAEEEMRYHSSSSIFGFEKLPPVRKAMMRKKRGEEEENNSKASAAPPMHESASSCTPSLPPLSSFSSALLSRNENVPTKEEKNGLSEIEKEEEEQQREGKERVTTATSTSTCRRTSSGSRNRTHAAAKELSDVQLDSLPRREETEHMRVEEKVKENQGKIITGSVLLATTTREVEERGEDKNRHSTISHLPSPPSAPKPSYLAANAGRTGMCFVIIDDELDFRIWHTGGSVLEEWARRQINESMADSSSLPFPSPLAPPPYKPLTLKLFAFRKTTVECPDILFHEMDEVRRTGMAQWDGPAIETVTAVGASSSGVPPPPHCGNSRSTGTNAQVGGGGGEGKVQMDPTYRPYYHTVTNKDGIFRFRSSPAVKHHEDSVLRVPQHSLLPPSWLLKLNITCVLRHSNTSEVILWQAGSPLSGGSGWWGHLWHKAASAWGIHRPIFSYLDFAMGFQHFFINDVIGFRMWAEGVGLDRPELLVLEQAPSSHLCMNAFLKSAMLQYFEAHPPCSPPQPPREVTLQRVIEKLAQLEREENEARVGKGGGYGRKKEGGRECAGPWSVAGDPPAVAELKSPYIAGLPLHRLGISSPISQKVEGNPPGRERDMGTPSPQQDDRMSRRAPSTATTSPATQKDGQVEETRGRNGVKKGEEMERNILHHQERAVQIKGDENEVGKDVLLRGECHEGRECGRMLENEEEEEEEEIWIDDDDDDDSQYSFTLLELETLERVLREQGRPTVALRQLIEVEKRIQGEEESMGRDGTPGYGHGGVSSSTFSTSYAPSIHLSHVMRRTHEEEDEDAEEDETGKHRCSSSRNRMKTKRISGGKLEKGQGKPSRSSSSARATPWMVAAVLEEGEAVCDVLLNTETSAPAAAAATTTMTTTTSSTSLSAPISPPSSVQTQNGAESDDHDSSEPRRCGDQRGGNANCSKSEKREKDNSILRLSPPSPAVGTTMTGMANNHPNLHPPTTTTTTGAANKNRNSHIRAYTKRNAAAAPPAGVIAPYEQEKEDRNHPHLRPSLTTLFPFLPEGVGKLPRSFHLRYGRRERQKFYDVQQGHYGPRFTTPANAHLGGGGDSEEEASRLRGKRYIQTKEDAIYCSLYPSASVRYSVDQLQKEALAHHQRIVTSSKMPRGEGVRERTKEVVDWST